MRDIKLMNEYTASSQADRDEEERHIMEYEAPKAANQDDYKLEAKEV